MCSICLEMWKNVYFFFRVLKSNFSNMRIRFGNPWKSMCKPSSTSLFRFNSQHGGAGKTHGKQNIILLLLICSFLTLGNAHILCYVTPKLCSKRYNKFLLLVVYFTGLVVPCCTPTRWLLAKYSSIFVHRHGVLNEEITKP